MKGHGRAILLGLCLAWALGFLRPVLLNSQREMAFPEYVPRANRVGSDLHWALEKCRRMTWAHPSPYTPDERLTISYPPAGMVALLPLTLLGEEHAYLVICAGTLVAFAFLVLGLPRHFGLRCAEIGGIVFVGGLFSYGLHFELERGAFNLIATALALGGIALHRSSGSSSGRLGGILLFSLGCQLKIYPLVYAVGFVRDLRDWREGLRIAGLLTVINGALLLVLGPAAFHGFLRCISQQAFKPYLWEGNLSAVSFAAWSGIPEPATFIFLLACGVALLARAIWLGRGGDDPFVFAFATTLALVLPATSHDYKLPLLAPAVVLVLAAVAGQVGDERTGVLLALGLSFCYHLTLFSYTNRRPLLENATPLVLLFMLLATVAAFRLGSAGPPRSASPS